MTSGLTARAKRWLERGVEYADDLAETEALIRDLLAEVEDQARCLAALEKTCSALEADREYNADLVRERDEHLTAAEARALRAEQALSDLEKFIYETNP